MNDEHKMRAAWEVYLYARDLVAKRMSYGMVAQSMLLIAFSTLAVGRQAGDFFLAFFQCTVGVLGVLYTIYQYYRVRNINDKIQHIEQKYLRGDDLVFKEYIEFRSRQLLSREFSQSAILIIFLAAWILMLIGAVALTPSED